MTNKDINVLVSGASVSGLSVAYWLARYGFEVTVVERAPHIRPGGQALDVRGPALEVAQRMGVLADLRDQSTHLTGMSVVDAAGKEIYRSTERTLTGGGFDSPDVEILRDDLCRIFDRAVGDRVEYYFDDAIVSLVQDEAGVDVVFNNAAPRRFDLVVGADGLHSGVRQLVFGPEEQFIQFLGFYLAVFAVPNFFGLDHWQVFHEHDDIKGGILALGKDTEAKTYIFFAEDRPLKFDYRDILAQKQLVAERVAGVGWEFPRILAYMQDAPDFHFDSASQICMNSWSRGRVVLLGDAAYSVSPFTGQGTTMAMVGAYVLAGELAAHRRDLSAGLSHYERELRDYVTRNQEDAHHVAAISKEPSFGQETDTEMVASPDGIPDFAQMVQPMVLKDYEAIRPH